MRSHALLVISLLLSPAVAVAGLKEGYAALAKKEVLSSSIYEGDGSGEATDSATAAIGGPMPIAADSPLRPRLTVTRPPGTRRKSIASSTKGSVWSQFNSLARR